MKTLAEAMTEIGIRDAALAARVGCDRSMVTRVRLKQVEPSLRLAVALHKATGADIVAMVKDAEAAQ